MLKITPETVVLPKQKGQALRVYLPYTGIGWEQWVWFQSDLHWDATDWQRALYHKHAQEALKRNALFFDLGDLNDAISGRGDPRGTKSTYRPEHGKGAYFDELVDGAVKEFKPYAQNIVLMGTGNHESKVKKIAETDLTTRIAEKLSEGRKVPIYRAGYSSWVQFCFSKRTGGGDRHSKQSLIAKLHHGHGGGGEVTKGVIQEHRTAAATENYDIYVSGHVHERYNIEHMVETMSPITGMVYLRKREHVRVGSYKTDWSADGADTWHNMRGGKGKPLGGKFVRFFCPETNVVDYEVHSPYVNYKDLAA